MANKTKEQLAAESAALKAKIADDKEAADYLSGLETDNVNLQAQVDALTKENADLKADPGHGMPSEDSQKEIESLKAALEESNKALTDQKQATIQQDLEYKEMLAKERDARTAQSLAYQKLAEDNDALLIAAKKWGIYTQEQAIEHVQKNYDVPAKVTKVMVVQDGSVFYDTDFSSGEAHARENKLMVFHFNKPAPLAAEA